MPSTTPSTVKPGRPVRARALAILALAGGLFAAAPAAQAAPIGPAPLAEPAPGIVAVQYGYGYGPRHHRPHHWGHHRRHWGHHHGWGGPRHHGWRHRHHGWGGPRHHHGWGGPRHHHGW